MPFNWTEKELAAALKSNPAIRINEKHSMSAQGKKTKKKNCISKKPKVILPPMKFYTDYAGGKEQTVKLFLPFTYPSLNKTKRMSTFAAWKAEAEFRDAVRWELLVNKILGFRQMVHLAVVIFHPKKRKRDDENYNYKWLKDALKGIVFVDDDHDHVRDEPVEFKKGKPHIEVYIIPASEVREREGKEMPDCNSCEIKEKCTLPRVLRRGCSLKMREIVNRELRKEAS
jgi:Holliday junction resolvase RusA-like endonuclease